MKKTLIALVALSGLAMADFDSDLSALVTSAGYTKGDSFTMSVTLDQFTWGGGDKALFTITDGTTSYTVGRHNTDKAFKWGWLTLSPTNSSIPTSGVLAGGVVDGTTTTWTIANATSSGLLASETQNLTNLGVTIESDGTGSTVTLTHMEGRTAGTQVLKFTGLAVDAADIHGLNLGSYYNSLTFTSTPATPEPATATLSLLALAGLAARRKRH